MQDVYSWKEHKEETHDTKYWIFFKAGVLVTVSGISSLSDTVMDDSFI